MKVAERFISINGESNRAGELASFVRFKGCNIRCSYCDTAWAYEADCPYEEMTPEEIVLWLKDTGVCNVTLTGGEPLLQKELPALLRLIMKEAELKVEIETNGTMDIADIAVLRKEMAHPEGITFTLDYKLPSSGCEDRMKTENYEHLMKHDNVKFVCGTREDLERAYEVMDAYSLKDRCQVYISPVFGNIEPVNMVEFMKERRMNDVRMQIQMHKVIWDPDKRGV